MVLTRQASPQDAATYLDLFRQILCESEFMLLEIDELTTTAEQQAQQIALFAETASGVLFLCEANGELVGFASARRGFARRQHHSLHVVMGVTTPWTGRGCGRLLLTNLEAWALGHRYHRLELGVNATNYRAIALYEKCGFEREGVKKESFRIGGNYFDELLMSKLISVARMDGSRGSQPPSRGAPSSPTDVSSGR